jgi:prepilin-type N-terminal cleavage/methylation domain-containing protein
MKNSKSHKTQKGFTFVEVLVVVIILSILVGAGIPAYLWTRSDARTRKKEVAIERVAEAKLKFYNANKTAAAKVPTPTPADIIYYLQMDPSEGHGSMVATTNAFYSDKDECIFKNCFPGNEIWYLNPMPRGTLPKYELISTTP